MTDEKLLQLVMETPPEDLSAEEIELLRERVRESPALRDALANQLHFDELMTGTLTRSQVSVDAILAKHHAAGWFGGPLGRRIGRWGLGMLLLAAMATGGYVISRMTPPDEAERLAHADKTALAKKSTAAVDESKKKATAPAKPAEHETAKEAGANPPEHEPAEKTAPKAPPPDPWTLATDPPRRPFAEASFDELKPLASDAESEALKEWWEPFKTDDLKPTKRNDLFGLSMKGRFKLRKPWPAGTVLRLQILDGESLQLQFWRGKHGVTLEYTERPQPAWIAYTASRPAGNDPPVDPVFASADDDRYRRAGKGTIELRCQDGQLVLSRGDVLLLAAPMSGQPDNVVLETSRNAIFLGGVAVTGGERFPLANDATAVAQEAIAPSRMVWRRELPTGARFEMLPDGQVELTAQDIKTPAWAIVPIREPGLQEIVCQVASGDAGTGICVVDDSGRAKVGVGLFETKNSRGKKDPSELVWGFGSPLTSQTESRPDKNRPQPYAGDGQWLRIIAGGGVFKVWLSVDGKHWGRAFEPRPIDASLTNVGIYCVSGKGTRHIRLRQLEPRPLAGIRDWADADLRDKVPASGSSNDFNAWLETIDKSQPPGADSQAWRRTCAIQTLAVGVRSTLAKALVWELAGQAADGQLPVPARLKMLDDLSLLADTWDTAGGIRIAQQYMTVGREMFATGQPRPFTAVRHAYLQSPFWTAANLSGISNTLLRDELLRLVYADSWDDLRQFCRQVRFFWGGAANARENRSADWPQTFALVDWAEALVQRNRPTEGNTSGRSILAAWRHPLVEQFGKEGYNVLAELEAALAGGAFKDACQIIGSVNAQQSAGLLPNAKDPALLVSLPGAVTLAMQDHPELRRAMQTEFGPLGQLRLRQAIAAEDPAAVQALTTQFYGTSASTDAQIWLGDRALAQGDFNAAESAYQAAANDLAPEDRSRVAARLRLAGAMLGRDEGEPVTEPVQLGETTLRPSEFEKLVTQMLTRNATSPGKRPSQGQLQWTADTAAPPAKTYTMQKLASIENPGGRDPSSPLRDVDWVGAQVGATLAPPRMLINTRSDLSAYDLESGQRVWSYSVGGESAKAGQWAMVPMHPLAAGDKVFARRLLTTGPELICVADGKLLWRSPKTEIVASDPCLLGDRLLAVTFAPAQQEMLQLSLTTFDLTSGKIISQQPLSQFRDVMQRELACQLTAVGEQLIVVGGGCVIGCDSSGQPQWLRRETWIAGVIVPRIDTQRYDVPLVHEKSLYVAQPGVPGIACLDLRTGRLQWQQAFANLVRMVGLADDKLIVQTADGFLGLDCAKGTFAWHHDVEDVLEGVVLGSDGRLFYAQSGGTGSKPSGANLVWLDAATGKSTATSSISGWQQDQPAWGPLVGANDRWYVLAGSSKRPPVRDLFRMQPTGEAEPPAP